MPSILMPLSPPQKKFNKMTSDRHDNMAAGVGKDKSKHASTKLIIPENVKFLLCCLMWYLCSSLSSNTGKLIMNLFRYPVTLTFTQFILVASWSAIMENIFKSTGIKRPTKIIAQTVIPLSFFMIFGHVFSSISISRIPVSLVHTIKALAPLFTVLLYRFIFKVKYTSKVYLALVPLTMGVILACSFTFSNNIIGLSCALASCLVFVMQNIVSKKLLFKESKMNHNNPNKLDKMNMMFYSSFFAFTLMFPLWLYSDGVRLMQTVEIQLDVSKSRLICYFLLNGTTHFAQSWFAFTTLSMSSPVTYSIASLVKRIFVIVLSILWFGQQVSVTQSLGIALTFVGLWTYQKAKREVDQGESKAREQSLGEILPTTTTTASKHVFDTQGLLNEKIAFSNAINFDKVDAAKKWIGNHLPDSTRDIKVL